MIDRKPHRPEAATTGTTRPSARQSAGSVVRPRGPPIPSADNLPCNKPELCQCAWECAAGKQSRPAGRYDNHHGHPTKPKAGAGRAQGPESQSTGALRLPGRQPARHREPKLKPRDDWASG